MTSTLVAPFDSTILWRTCAQIMKMIAQSIIQLMTSEQLRDILITLNLNIGLNLIQDICLFIQQRQILPVGHESSRILIYAASAIATQIKRMPTIDNGQVVRTGIGIQNFLRHVQPEDKLLFLEKVNDIISTWENAPIFLKDKIKEVCRTYNIFLKYRSTFTTLSEQTNTQSTTMMNQMSIFWMVYVLSKHHQPHHSKLSENQELCLLFSLIKYVFQEFLSNTNSLQVNSILENYFNNANIPNINTIQIWTIQFKSILKTVYEIRYFDKNQTYSKSHLYDHFFLQRFLDYFSNHLQREVFNYQGGIIDQLSYIQLEKTLTPQNIYKSMIECEPISQKINFDSQDEGENQA